MKKNLAISLLAAVALVAQANVIPWSIDGIEQPYTTASSPTWQYVFLTSESQSLTGNENSNVDSTVENNHIYAEGVWSDSSSNPSQQYIVAIWDGVSGPSSYKFFEDGEHNKLTVTYSDLFPEAGDPTLGPASSASGSLLSQISSGTVSISGHQYVAVPEPATAALAFLGVAMLIRRRK